MNEPKLSVAILCEEELADAHHIHFGPRDNFLLHTICSPELLNLAIESDIEFRVLVIDNTAFDLNQLQSLINRSDQVILFNYDQRPKKGRGQTEHWDDLRTKLVTRHIFPGVLMPHVLEKILTLSTDSPESPITRIDRRVSNSENIRTVVATPDKFATELIPLFQCITSVIERDTKRLSAEFVSRSSSRTVPELQMATESEIRTIEVAEQYLLDSMRDLGQRSMSRGCFVLGRSGAGKTTLGHHVSLQALEGKKILPFVVDFSLFAFRHFQDDIGLLNVLVEKLSSVGPNPLDLEPLSLAKQNADKLVAGESISGIRELRDELRLIIEQQSLTDDGGVLLELYHRHGNGSEKGTNLVGINNPQILLQAAKNWFDSGRANTPETIVGCLFKYIREDRKRTVNEFIVTCCVIQIAQLVTKKNIPNKHLLCKSFLKQAKCIWSDERSLEHVQMSLKCDDPINLVRCVIQLSELDQSRLLHRFLNSVSSRVSPLIVFDNIDQKNPLDVEELLAGQSISFFHNEFTLTGVKSYCVVCMRSTTFYRSKSARAEIRDFTSVEVTPAELSDVIEKRCNGFMGTIHAKSSANVVIAAKSIQRLIDSWRKKECDPLDASDLSKCNLIDFTLWRHPYNLRRQLFKFVESLSGAVGARDILTQSMSISGQHQLRAFFMGRAATFSESVSKILNVYDGGFPESPFNTVARPWALDYVTRNPTVSREMLTQYLGSLGIEKNLANFTADSFVEFHLLLPRTKAPELLDLSGWGQNFARLIYDLPYIDTVWWATPIQSQFSLSHPRIIPPDELRGYANKFLAWLRYEDVLSRHAMDKSSAPPFSLRDKCFVNVMKSLTRIEFALSR